MSTTKSKPAKPASKTKTTETATATKAKAAASKTEAPITAVKANAPQAVIMGPMMRKKELVEIVVARSGMKKKDVKPIVEMTLSVLGDAIADNRELNLPPMGRMKVKRAKTLANGRMAIAKIRQTTPAEPDAVAPAAEPEDY